MRTVFIYSPSFTLSLLSYNFRLVSSSRIISSLFLAPPPSRGGAIQNVPVDAASKALEAEDSQDEDEAEDSLERTSSTMSPPPAVSKDLGIDKKRKRVKELASLSASAHKTVAGEVSALGDEEELFDALDS
jgi:hypothetical protein